MVTALVPLKDLVMAKSRLSGVMTPSERRALAQAMAQDVLAVLAAHPRIDSTVLVSDDPAAGLLTEHYRMVAWSEASLGVHGLNRVLQAACGRLTASGAGAGTVLVLHADLPLLEAADIERVLDEQGRTGGLVIATDHEGVGTNLLAFGERYTPHFRFGINSRQLHEQDALRQQIPVSVLTSAGLSGDVDEVRDLQAYLQQAGAGSGSKTASFLRSAPIAGRLALTLAQLAAPADAAAGQTHLAGGGSRSVAETTVGTVKLDNPSESGSYS
ncbi:MAG: 2-phospho-L-lactate guanylyltransferase [Gammaproteobacteria bacterium]|nr:2-phospho-L-lactate guanylyltransferase [Gammaproteobacteria bacterium]